MKISIFIFIELFFIMLIGIIVYVAKVQKNFLLSYKLNLVILTISILKLTWILHAQFNGIRNTCQFAKSIHCS